MGLEPHEVMPKMTPTVEEEEIMEFEEELDKENVD